MTAEIIPFSPIRFTPADLAMFNAIAEPRLERGLWRGVERLTDEMGDRLLITFPRIDRTVFMVERDRRGAYHLWFQDKDGWTPIGTGQTAAAALSIWAPRETQAEKMEIAQ